MKKDHVRLLTDTRLSTDARTLALYVATLGDGEHEVPFSMLRSLLNCAGERKVREALREATDACWILRREGGRGHHAVFEFTPAKNAEVNAAMAASPTAEPDTSAKGADLSAHTSAESAGVSFTSAETADLNAPSRARVAVAGEAEAVELPPVIPLASLAEEAIEANAERLAGCRGALRDYLRQRVPSPRQSAFVWSAVGWLDSQGFAWGNDEGAVAPPGERPRLLANALNQLLASDEKGYKAPEGDPRNVLSKLRIICGQHGRQNGRGNPGGNGGRPADGGSPAAASTGKGGRRFNSE